MVSEQLLVAGSAILVIGVISMLLGKAPVKIFPTTDYRNEHVTLAPEGQPLFIKRYTFGVAERSRLHFSQSPQQGPFEVFIVPIPVSPPSDPLAGWGFSHGKVVDFGTRENEFWINAGGHAIEFVNRAQSPSSTTFTLTLTRSAPLIPWLGEIGSSLLVIAIPILVTGFLS